MRCERQLTGAGPGTGYTCFALVLLGSSCGCDLEVCVGGGASGGADPALAGSALLLPLALPRPHALDALVHLFRVGVGGGSYTCSCETLGVAQWVRLAAVWGFPGAIDGVEILDRVNPMPSTLPHIIRALFMKGSVQLCRHVFARPGWHRQGVSANHHFHRSDRKG